MSVPHRLSTIVITALFLCAFACAHAEQKPAAEPEPDLPVQQWLLGPDHTDFPAEYKALSPRLTYQQRFLVETRVAISGEIARGRDLHIWLKVADHGKNWLPGHTHIHSEASTTLTRKSEFQFVAGFFASPGQYTVGLVIYDAKSQKYNVRHLPVTVDAIKNDPLESHLESSGQAVEFLSAPPPGLRSFQDISEVSRDEPDSLWPFAKRIDTYPLTSARPVQIDILLNFSDPGEAFSMPPSLFTRRSRFDAPLTPVELSRNKIQQRQKEYIGALLSTAQVLAAIHPANGCVRISGIDITSMEVAFRRSSPATIDWDKLRNLRSTTKLAEISVNALQNRKDQPIFLRDFITALQAPIEGCASSTTAPPLHVVLFVSHSFSFASGAHKVDFHLDDRSNFRIHYFQLNAGSRAPYDDLGSSLKSAGAKSHDINEPRQFRDALAKTISDLSSRASGK